MKRNVGAVCIREVTFGYAKEPILEIAKRMRENHVGAVVLVREDDGERYPVGIVTDRDIVVGAVASAPDELGSLVADDLVIRDLVSVHEDDSIDDALEVMRKYGVRRVPVVGDEGELVGILAVDDLVELFADRLAELAVLFSREQRIEREARP
ncbi:Hypoxic response protein 1 [Enhygromyxa salina]|uniref:Hypoxic response protein 1 n=1 Tax=Enhygromyxa salina TaxID=215803 RepID=A0A2S9XB82_9BACT|nr:CBS domain-containing protein [Enhygromyxa salina]PRP90060.1 Hypoxic response protein 1 [Enhygromyxa salina]